MTERTSMATKEISTMITSIQRETKGAVSSMEEGVRQVENGTEASAQSGRTLEEILAQISEVASQVTQIATVIDEQTATTSEITSNISRIDGVVHQPAKGAAETAQASAQLSEMSETLQGIVRQFKLS